MIWGYADASTRSWGKKFTLGRTKKREKKKKGLARQLMPGSVSDRTKKSGSVGMRDAASWWNKNGGKRSGLNTPPSSQNSESSSSSKKKAHGRATVFPQVLPRRSFDAETDSVPLYILCFHRSPCDWRITRKYVSWQSKGRVEKKVRHQKEFIQ